jgi:hypothetical protein
VKGHCYSPENLADRLKQMVEYVLNRMPAGTVAE